MHKKFTLIELLVVIAIIGILASILMPALEKARIRTQIAVCKSNLKQVGILSYLHLDTYERFPLAGAHVDTSCDKEDLNTVQTGDGYAAPWIAALTEYSSAGDIRMDTLSNMKADILDEESMSVFLCPLDVEKENGDIFIDTTWQWTSARTSYGFNEAVLGAPYGTTPFQRLHGLPGSISDTSKTFLFAEGGARTIWNPFLGFHDNAYDRTLADAYNNNGAGHSSVFRPNRHLNIQTIVFADGSVREFNIKDSSRLNEVYLFVE